MKPSKSPMTVDSIDILAEDRQERQIALEYVAQAWNEAEDDGIASQALAHASLFAAITSMVEHHGEHITAELIASLPERIRHGEYNLTRSLQ
jgi:predicted YcjX-like family ATPase